MSIHEETQFFSGADVVAEDLARLPSPIQFLNWNAEASFKPANSDASWTASAGKRAFDLAIAVPLTLLFAPLMLVIAALILLDSKGPVLFRQQRAGMCGRSFRILKFRTMRVLEDGAVVTQAKENDPRVTKLGAFLRRYSLDELPQLLNVVMGDMSLVGPRPHALAHDRYYESVIRDYSYRQAAKPGMTGWAQINGHRGPTPTIDVMAERISHDSFYVRRASFLFDLAIFLRTPFEIIRPRNAV